MQINPPLALLEDGERHRATLIDEVEDQESAEQGGDSRIICATCGHLLTTAKAWIEIDGAHRHVKVNPHGHVYHFALFDPVPGVLAIGLPSAEWSWFGEFSWQIGLCGGCQVHLGWVFSGDGEFAALIEGRFMEEKLSE